MKKNIPAFLLTGSALVLTGVFVWWLGSAPSSAVQSAPKLARVAEADQPLSMIHEMQQASASWSLAALRTLTIANSDFDDVAGILARVRVLRSQLRDSELNDGKASSELKRTLNRFLALGEAQEEAIEQFKSNHAAMRNSLRYLPLAFSAGINAARKLDSTEPLDRLRNADDRMKAFMNTPSESGKTALMKEIQSMEQSSMSFPPDFANALNNYISHAYVLLERKIPMEEIIQRVADDSSAKAGDELIAQYRRLLTARDDTRAQQVSDYQSQHAMDVENWGAIMMLIGLLAGVLGMTGGVLLWKEQQHADKRIDAALKQKTAELDEAMRKHANTQVESSQSASLASVSRMAASLAHEINTPLGYLSSNMEMLDSSHRHLDHLVVEVRHLLEDLNGSMDDAARDARLKAFATMLDGTQEGAMLDEMPNILSDMNSGVDQIQHLITDLKGFSHNDRAEQDWYELNEAVEAVLKMTKPKLSGNIEVITQLADTPKLFGSPGQINQVITNLVVNAAQAIESADQVEGKISIITKVSGNDVLLSVTDNGVGIPKEESKRIFEPFYTTKGPGEGTGLGLAIVSRITNQHGGKIRMKSVLGKGTTIQIVLPKDNA